MSAENWQNRDDRPYGVDSWHDEPPSRSWLTWVLLAVLVAVIGGAGYYYWQKQLEPEPPARVGVEPRVPALPPQAEKPAIQFPVPDVEEPAEQPLPALEQSDARIGELVTGLVGRGAFKSFVSPAQLIRRIVATVDNLPRKIAPVRMRPVPPVPGQFTPGARNQARYSSHVKAFQAIDARALVQGYAKLYPLFQRAYADLGYRDRHFNDRLVEAIDDMLAAPELTSPPELVQPKVLYQYADPALEGRSAGQKFMMRLGAENAAKVKAKLREIRRELTAASPEKSVAADSRVGPAQLVEAK
jgi:Protein of unknown function (DUF3014)